MIPAKLTLEAIDRKLEAEQEDGFRKHLGASVVGKACLRESWYDFRWTLREQFTGQQLRLFGRGHLEEARFVGYLRKIGCKVWEFNPEAPLKDGKPQQFRVSAHDGHFGGSLDGVAMGVPDLPQGIPCTLSFKTHNDKSFQKLLDMGVMGSKWEHFIQEQTYLHLMPKSWGLKHCLYLAVNKNTDHIHTEILNYDSDVSETTLKRGGDVIYSNVPLARISNTPGAFACKFCRFNRLCHFGDVLPAVNCRTCRFSRVGGNGLWKCGLRNIDLDEAAQKAGCGSYQVNPVLQGVQP